MKAFFLDGPKRGEEIELGSIPVAGPVHRERLGSRSLRATPEHVDYHVVGIWSGVAHLAVITVDENEETTPMPGRLRLVCSICGTTCLEHYYSSKRDGRVLCPPCFSKRKTQRFAKEVEN